MSNLPTAEEVRGLAAYLHSIDLMAEAQALTALLLRAETAERNAAQAEDDAKVMAQGSNAVSDRCRFLVAVALACAETAVREREALRGALERVEAMAEKACALAVGTPSYGPSMFQQIRSEASIALSTPVSVQGGEAAQSRADDQSAALALAVEALEPFAKIAPSGFYSEDGSEAEKYQVLLARDKLLGDHHDFTGADLARARDTLAKLRAQHQGGGHGE